MGKYERIIDNNHENVIDNSNNDNIRNVFIIYRGLCCVLLLQGVYSEGRWGCGRQWGDGHTSHSWVIAQGSKTNSHVGTGVLGAGVRQGGDVEGTVAVAVDL